MRRIAFAAFIAFAYTIGTFPASAKTASATIGESAQIVPGNSVSAYLTAGGVITDVRDDSSSQPLLHGRPIVRIGFEMNPSWHLVKRVHWDRTKHQLTIDF